MRRLLPVLFVVVLSACSALDRNVIRKDYETADQKQTVRIVVFVSPVPEGGEKVAAMWADIARKYANDHRDFIVKAARYGATTPDDLCGQGIEGVLQITPHLNRLVDEVEASAQAKLWRCRDGEVIWDAAAEDAYESADPVLAETTAHYVQKFGPEVKHVVAPSFHVLKAVLDALPVPKMPDDNAVMEKIELAD